MDERTDGQMMDGRTEERTDGQMMDGRTEGRTDGCADIRMDEWIDR